MDVHEVLAAIRASWWLPFLCLLAGGGGGLTVSLLQTPLYESSTQFFISTTDSLSTADVFQGSQFSEQRVSSYAQLLEGQELAGRVIDRLDLGESPRVLSERTLAMPVTDTVLIDFSVLDESPSTAREIASTYGAEFEQFVAELEASSAVDVSPVRVRIVEDPTVPDGPSTPATLRNIAVGLLLGAFLGGLWAVARVRLDRTVKTAEAAVELGRCPVIGAIPQDDLFERGHVLDRNSLSITAESMRQLRTNLQFLSVDEPPKVIMISSSVPAEGKTTLAINLALALADAGRSVTIIEADLRRPRVTRYLGMVGGVGLTNLLTGTADVDDVLQAHGAGDLSVIAAGPTPPNPGELLSSSNMFKVIDDLRSRNDFVLVDAPPLLPVADSSGLAVLVDGVVLSLKYGSTRQDQLREARDILDRVGATTLGVVFNFVPQKARLRSAYGNVYDYGYDPDPAPPASS